nr:zinc finger, CCHC-type [Tanacetum cinerariifolium]
MFVIEQPIPPAPAAYSEANVLPEWNALYDVHNEVACLMLGSMTPELPRQFEIYSPYEMLQELSSMFEKQAGVERFDLIQTFHACKQEEVGLFLNGLTKDFAGFVRNYNMHNMGKTIGELHAMLIEYEKGLPKKAETRQVMMIKGGKIQKAKKKSLKAKGKGKANGKGNNKQVHISKPKNLRPYVKEHPTKDDACHHCKKVGHWKMNCPVYLAELLKKKKQVGSVSSSVLRVEKKMFVIEQPIPPAPTADSEANVLAEWNSIYDAYNDVAYLMLGNMTPELHRQFENYSPYDMLQELKSMFEAGMERFDLIQTFHACKQEEGKPVRAYTIGKLHAMLIEYEKGLPKKAETPQVMMIKSGKIQKANKKSLKAKGKGRANGKGKDKQGYIPKTKNPKPYAKEHLAKDDTYHNCKEGFREARKLKQRALYLYVGNGVREQVEAIRSFDLVLPNGLVIFLDNCYYAPSITRGVVSVHRLVENEFVQCFADFGISVSKNNVHYFIAIPSNGIYEIDMHEWLLRSTDDESFDQCVSCLSGKMTRKSFPHRLERATDLLGIIHTDVCGPLRHVSRQESATRILNMVPTKKVDKTSYELWYGKVLNLSYLKVWRCEALVKQDTPDKLQQRPIIVARYAEFFEKNLITQEVSGRAMDLVEIQDEDASPSEITSKIPMEVEGFEPPQEEVIPICRSKMTHRAPDSLCLNVEVEKHSLGDLNEPSSYKAVMLDSESNKWIDAMNAEIQSMINNMVWVLVDLPPGCKTVGSFVDSNHPRKVCKLQRSIYGLKQASRSWNKRFDEEIKRTQDALTPKEVKRMQNVPYASAVGSIMYAVRCTRPDVAFTQNIISRFQQNSGECHWTAVKHIFKYLRNTKDTFLVYGGNPEAELQVDCYCDAGFETDRDDTKSQTGYVFILKGGAVDRKSFKQSTTAMSATEAEYIGASEATMEAVWIRKFISGLGIVPTINEPIRMFCDNSSALHFANDPGVQKGTRHYHRRYHYIRESIALGEIRSLKVTQMTIWLILLRRLYVIQSLLNMLGAWDFV